MDESKQVNTWNEYNIRQNLLLWNISKSFLDLDEKLNEILEKNVSQPKSSKD